MQPDENQIVNAQVYVEHLLAYAVKELALNRLEIPFRRNALLETLALNAPSTPVEHCEEDLDDILRPLLEYALACGLCDELSKERFGVKLVGLVMPTPSEVSDRFDAICFNDGVRAACDWLYDLSQKSGYIPAKAIARNPKWRFEGAHGEICITINTAKPEKDPKEVAAAKAAPQTGYPKCMLCIENMGYPGRVGYPARQTLRCLPLPLSNGELWYMQYSPYSYFAHHCIFFNAVHQPMALSENSYRRILDMLKVFPYYFIGSNAPLPIVGGSILSHDHYQGGGKVHPMFARYLSRRYTNPAFPKVKIGLVDWYNSVIRLRSRDKEALVKAVAYVNSLWSTYNDAKVGILAHTGDTPHNCITPIFRIERGEFYAELILRNNRTDEKHPYGIFHPTEDMHHIKKEAIGIIEVLGTFILPGRLAAELDGVADILCGAKTFDEKALKDPANPLSKHAAMIVELLKANGIVESKEKAEELVRLYVNRVGEKILDCTAVFKNDEAGQEAFDRFMKSWGCVDFVYKDAEEEEGVAPSSPEVKEEEAPREEPVKRKRGRPRKNPIVL